MNQMTGTRRIPRRSPGRFVRYWDDHGMAANSSPRACGKIPAPSDGGFSGNDPKERDFAIWRGLRSVDIANELGADKIVLWLAREGTLCFESKNPVEGVNRLVDGINRILEYDQERFAC